MRLGIDFGTTRTVVAAVDRGNYPLISFHNEKGESMEWYPSVAAFGEGKWRFGLDAMEKSQETGWTLNHSFKRALAEIHPHGLLQGSQREISLLELLTRFLTTLRGDLVKRSNLEVSADEALEVVIAVPANANNNQRFLTLEAFRNAGFDVIGLVNEPAAAGIEYAHRHGVKGARSRKHYLLVYDLGGGTFDVAIIGIGAHRHEAVINEGIMHLGGDDFDALLCDLALEQAGRAVTLNNDARRGQLLEECREKKEGLHPNTRKIAIDLERAVPGAGVVTVSTADYYRRCAPLVEQTIDVVERAVEQAAQRHDIDWESIASLYVVGGGSSLPSVGRSLRKHYARRVRRSAYPHGAVAVGLAVIADGESGLQLQERFTRNFGVWREWDEGHKISFDTLFAKETLLPQAGQNPLVLSRAYLPTHNIGRFRFLECSRLQGDDHHPDGDITPWDEIVFPFDHRLQTGDDLADVPVETMDPGHLSPVEEIYTCNHEGMLELTIRDSGTGYQRTWQLRG